jgi:hypothetical protein
LLGLLTPSATDYPTHPLGRANPGRDHQRLRFRNPDIVVRNSCPAIGTAIKTARSPMRRVPTATTTAGRRAQVRSMPVSTCIKPLCVGPVNACPVFDPGKAECAAIGAISASDPTKANLRMRNLASCHGAAYDTQPIMVERRPFVPQGAIAAVRSERMGGCLELTRFGGHQTGSTPVQHLVDV